MSKTTVTRMDSEELPTFMRHVNDTTLAALKNTQIGFVISMSSVDPFLRGDALREHITKLFPLAHFFERRIADMPRVWLESRSILDMRGATL